MLTQMEEHVLSLKRNLYTNSGCQLEAETINLCITSFVAWSLYLGTAVIKLGAVLHSVVSGYCWHQIGCSGTFCHVWVVLSSSWVQSYILSCLDAAVIKLGALLYSVMSGYRCALLHSVMSGYCCRQAGCSATFCHVWILLSSSWVHCYILSCPDTAVHCYILSCLDTAVVKLGAVLHSTTNYGYWCDDGVLWPWSQWNILICFTVFCSDMITSYLIRKYVHCLQDNAGLLWCCFPVCSWKTTV